VLFAGDNYESVKNFNYTGPILTVVVIRRGTPISASESIGITVQTVVVIEPIKINFVLTKFISTRYFEHDTDFLKYWHYRTDRGGHRADPRLISLSGVIFKIDFVSTKSISTKYLEYDADFQRFGQNYIDVERQNITDLPKGLEPVSSPSAAACPPHHQRRVELLPALRMLNTELMHW
jgi:hypothetical protein